MENNSNFEFFNTALPSGLEALRAGSEGVRLYEPEAEALSDFNLKLSLTTGVSVLI